MNSALYDIAVRLSVTTSALQTGVALATRLFGQIETAATRAESAAAGAFSRMGSAHQSLAQATLSSEAAQIRYNRALDNFNTIAANPKASSAALDAAQARMDLAQISVDKATLTQTAAQNALANAKGTYATASAAAVAAQQQQERIGAGMNRMMTGAMTAGVGLGIGALLVGSIKKALGLSVIDTGISAALTDASGRRLSAGQNAAKMAALQQMEVRIGTTNQMSVTDVASIVAAAAHAGMTRTDVLLGTKTQASILPGLANLGEVLKMTRHYAPEQSATIGSEFAHLFGAWTPGLFSQMTDLLGRALTVSPATPSEFLRLTSQFAGTLRPLYGTSAADKQRFISDAVITSALESELGQQTRGGTQLARMVTRLIGSSSRTRGAAQDRALEQMARDTGVQFFNPKTGAFAGVSKTIEAIAKEVKYLHNPMQEERLFQAAFGLVGARQAGLIGDPTTLARLGVLSTMLGPTGLPSLKAIQQQYNQSPQGQMNQAMKNWDTFVTLFGTQLLPLLTKALPVVVGLTKALVEFASANPGILKAVAALLALAATVLVVAGSIMMVSGALTILKGIGPIFKVIGAVAGPLIDVLAGVAAAVAAFLGLPVWVVVAIAVAIGAAIVALVKFHDQIGKFVEGILQFLHLLPAPVPPGAAASNGAIATNGQGQTVREVIGPGHEVHWVPVHPGPPHHGGHGVGGGGRTIQIGPFHLHGMDHQSAEQVAQRVVDHVKAALGADLQHDEYYHGLGDLSGSLTPGRSGY